MTTLPTTRPGDIIRELAAELHDGPAVAGERLAAAFRGRTFAKPIRRSAPTERACSPEPCPFCQIPGFKGCDHYLPYQSAALPHRKKRDAWSGILKQTERRSGERHPVYDEIIRFCRATGMTRTGVCREAGFDSALFTRIQEGATPSEETLKGLRDFMEVAERNAPDASRRAREQQALGGGALYQKIIAFCEANDMAPWRFGREVLSDPAFCSQLRAGRNPSERTVAVVLRYIDANGGG